MIKYGLSKGKRKENLCVCSKRSIKERKEEGDSLYIRIKSEGKELW
jgi:hypothetical protein